MVVVVLVVVLCVVGVLVVRWYRRRSRQPSVAQVVGDGEGSDSGKSKKGSSQKGPRGWSRKESRKAKLGGDEDRELSAAPAGSHDLRAEEVNPSSGTGSTEAKKGSVRTTSHDETI